MALAVRLLLKASDHRLPPDNQLSGTRAGEHFCFEYFVSLDIEQLFIGHLLNSNIRQQCAECAEYAPERASIAGKSVPSLPRPRQMARDNAGHGVEKDDVAPTQADCVHRSCRPTCRPRSTMPHRCNSM
jgi:hypothetical protein